MNSKLIVRLSNNLGNQMFMYASAFIFAKKLNRKFFYDDENTKSFFTMAKYSIGTHVEFFYSDIIENHNFKICSTVVT